MHVVEAATIMKNDPPVGRGDVSPCLPGWIETMCDAFQRGEGYALTHSAVSALAHTLIGGRVRAERLVQERDSRVELKWEHEDQLHRVMNREVYVQMFHASEVIDGVRMFPYVEQNGERFFLVRE